jgi:hypothetical protein
VCVSQGNMGEFHSPCRYRAIAAAVTQWTAGEHTSPQLYDATYQAATTLSQKNVHSRNLGKELGLSAFQRLSWDTTKKHAVNIS